MSWSYTRKKRKPVRVLYPNRLFFITGFYSLGRFLFAKMQSSFIIKGVKIITVTVINVEIWDRIRMHLKLFTR